jgi:hypothetical protein
MNLAPFAMLQADVRISTPSNIDLESHVDFGRGNNASPHPTATLRIRFLFVRPAIWLQLPPDSQSLCDILADQLTLPFAG